MSELLERRQRLLGAAPLFYREPVHIVRGDGVWLYGADGKQYLDMYNNVPCVGHANLHVVDAMQRQMGTLNVHSRYLHEGILDYAERLLALHDDSIEKVVFACSGTEAVEVAIQMARVFTGGQGIICTDATYHGNSSEVGKMSRVKSVDPSSTLRSVPFPQTYRPLEEGVSGSDLTDLYLARIQEAIDQFAANAVPFAGMIVCSLQANEGLPDIPVDFMSRAAELVRQAGGLFIADEVQAGFCRSGNWWGYETTGFCPDIAVMGKPMGNGLPLSGVAGRGDIVDAFRKRTWYFNTFASSPLQAAVGMAVLDFIERENLLQSVRDTGDYLADKLKARQADHPSMGDLRGHGLFLGIEWVKDKASKQPDREGAMDVAERLKDNGILLANAGALGNIIKIRPPLVYNTEHADHFLEVLDAVV